MSDPAPTRQETVEANIAAVLSEYSKDAKMEMIYKCIQDISISLAMLVDAGSST